MLVVLETGIPSNVATPLGIAAAMTGGLSLVVAVGTLVKAVMEFKRQNALKRFEKYQEMNNVYTHDATLTAFRDALRAGGETLAKYEVIEKYRFMAFYEDIAMMCQSGLMRIEVAAYLFGYDARKAANTDEFAANLENIREDPNWTLFWCFCDRLNTYAARLDRKRKKLDPTGRNRKLRVEELRF
jgi:hypothetical protein